jgi:hypothetical protein
MIPSARQFQESRQALFDQAAIQPSGDKHQKRILAGILSGQMNRWMHGMLDAVNHDRIGSGGSPDQAFDAKDPVAMPMQQRR